MRMLHFRRITNIRQNLRSKKQNHKTIIKNSFRATMQISKNFRNSSLKLRNELKKQKKNDIIKNYFVIENARKRCYNDAK